jgi:hypothetical protein
MGLLDDHLALHAGQIGRLLDEPPSRTGEDSRGPQGQSRGCARGDHGGLAADQRGQALADRVVQLVPKHVVLRTVVDRVHDFRKHERSGHGGVDPRRVDKRANAEFLHQVALGAARECPLP